MRHAELAAAQLTSKLGVQERGASGPARSGGQEAQGSASRFVRVDRNGFRVGVVSWTVDLHAQRSFLPGRLSLIDAWAVLVGLVFIGAGLSRFIPATGVWEELAHLGVPPWLIVVSGLTETVGGLVVLVPRVRFLGAGICGASMVGATFTNLRAEAYADAVSPILLGLMALTVVIVYRQQGVDLLARLSPR